MEERGRKEDLKRSRWEYWGTRRRDILDPSSITLPANTFTRYMAYLGGINFILPDMCRFEVHGRSFTRVECLSAWESNVELTN